MVLPGGSLVKNPSALQETQGLIPELGRSPREGNGNFLQYSYLENSTDRGAWLQFVESQRSWTRLSDLTTIV